MADDAGALLVRSGLVSSNALDDARARVASIGGTLGEQLVTTGAIADDALTDFYTARLLVPQVNPNTLARLTPKVVATIPGDMAIELRAIPVSLDGNNNLTVAMSDPSDRHAVDEIAFFTGAYVVRAVATQMQIAWCLAHYYGHVTVLGQRLLSANERETPIKAALAAASTRIPRAKGLTGKVNASRHRAVAPVTGPVNPLRPTSDQLDQPHAAPPEPIVPATAPIAAPSPRPASTPAPVPANAAARAPAPATNTPVLAPAAANAATRAPAATTTPAPAPAATNAVGRAPAPAAHAPVPAPAAANAAGRAPAPAATTPAPAPAAANAVGRAPAPAAHAPAPAPAAANAAGHAQGPAAHAPAVHAPAPAAHAPDDVEAREPARRAHTETGPDDSSRKLRARSMSGEIRAPIRRAASIRPPMPSPDLDDDEPQIVIEHGADDEAGGTARAPARRRNVKSDPPELYARAGEVDLKSGADHVIDDEPRIVIDEDALSPVMPRTDTPTEPATAPILTARGVHANHVDHAAAGLRAHDDDDDDGDDDGDGDATDAAMIHDRLADRDSQPILLDRPRGTPEPYITTTVPTSADGDDAADDDVVVLDARKTRPRLERRTKVGVPPAPVPPNPPRDTEPGPAASLRLFEDVTVTDLGAVPSDDDTTSDLIAAPPPDREDDTNPFIIAAPPAPAPPRPLEVQAAPPSGIHAAIADGDGSDDDDDEKTAVDYSSDDDDDDDDDDTLDEPAGRRTNVMSAVELDDAIPERTAEVIPGHLAKRRIDYDAVDDGWGPPGTTIPPPLLGAIPGSEDDDTPGAIPMPSVDSSPLLVGPSPRPPTDASGRALVRALEEATARAIEVIRQLERTQTRDQVVDVMISHLSETHHRAGFFVNRPAATKGITELSLFAMTPRPEIAPFAILRLDRPSTLADVVGTRLPYRGPMHDDASRSFLVSVLGACPPEILLVPVAVRERVVGVLFGEHRQRHTFDDQLALAARAAGMALERILKARRS